MDEIDVRIKQFEDEISGLRKEISGLMEVQAECMRLKKEVQFLLDITGVIVGSHDFNSALMSTVKKVCEATNWCYGEAWIPDAESSVLRCSPVWYSNSESVRGFRTFSEKIRFSPGVGLPGRVWSTKKSEWIPDVSSVSEKIYLRARIAEMAGLRAAFGAPIMDENGEVLTVLAFYLSERREEDRHMIDLISTASLQLGTLIQLKRSEEELKRSHKRLRNLSRRLQSILEEERRFISREIHDELGQALTALKMDLSWLRRRLKEKEKDLIEKADSMSGLIDGILNIVKRISAELRPGIIDDLGIVDAVRWYTKDFSGRTGINCETDITPEGIVLGRNISINVFRVLQEALTNVARHSKADTVRVSLKEESGILRLVVGDNGVGITMKQVSDPASTGLIGIRERVCHLGGSFKIEGTTNSGTTITVTLPLREYDGGRSDVKDTDCR